jgi:hypothetical protein
VYLTALSRVLGSPTTFIFPVGIGIRAVIARCHDLSKEGLSFFCILIKNLKAFV